MKSYVNNLIMVIIITLCANHVVFGNFKITNTSDHPIIVKTHFDGETHWPWPISTCTLCPTELFIDKKSGGTIATKGAIANAIVIMNIDKKIITFKPLSIMDNAKIHRLAFIDPQVLKVID